MDTTLQCRGDVPDAAGVAGSTADCFGPFFPQYPTWFGRGVIRARDLAGRPRVCFAAVGWAMTTREPYIGSTYYADDACSGPSPLLRRYAAYVAERWGLDAPAFLPRAYRDNQCRARAAPVSNPTLPLAAGETGSNCRPYIRIVHVVRRPNSPPSAAVPLMMGIPRRVANADALLLALRGAAEDARVDADVVEADFALLPYGDQVALVRRSHLLVGIHGAGMTHAVNMAPRDACGGVPAVVELFPEGNLQRGVRNLVVQLGLGKLQQQKHPRRPSPTPPISITPARPSLHHMHRRLPFRSRPARSTPTLQATTSGRIAMLRARTRSGTARR